MLSNREAIEEHLDARLERIREGQVGAAFKQGEQLSKEQETILDFISHYLVPNHGEESAPVEEHSSLEEWADALHERLNDVKLANTDEDRILRETFRHHPEYESFTEWPAEEFLTELNTFLEENIEASSEYQDTLVGESAVQARLVCWGVVGR
jgi:hypothetical protein